MSGTVIDFYPTGWWARLLGLWGVQDGWRSWRFKWGELSFRYPQLGGGYSVYHEEAHFWLAFLLFAIYVKAPMLIHQREGTEDWNASYGMSIRPEGIHLNWRDRFKVIDWPWSLEWMKTEVLSYSGMSVWEENRKSKQERTSDPEQSLARWKAKYEAETAARTKHSKMFPYRYVRLSSEVQEREATVSVSRMTWGWPRFSLPLRTRTTIDVKFSDEVGERTGSWKGGTVGCSYELLPGETPYLCLRRMERERKF